jgi:hypothetical protein
MILSSVLSAMAECAMSIVETTVKSAIPRCLQQVRISSPP